ncbi:hypothetical protein M3Y99_00237500 [Aphelenchoides fujianensis]|nr:hypothetical protein M3Y99_00237500 [Aphelenchoides fujianensis]
MEELAIAKPKPQIRTGAADVRDKLNRFLLLDAMLTDKKKGSTRLLRLAAVSRAQLEAVRRSVRGIKFKLVEPEWALELELGGTAPPVEFSVRQKEMSGIAKLLGVPVHLNLGWNMQPSKNVDVRDLERIKDGVNGLTASYCGPSYPLWKFIKSVAPQLKELVGYSLDLNDFPPMDLEKLYLFAVADDRFYDTLSRHKIRRLDVLMWEVQKDFPSNRVLSESITSLGLVDQYGMANAAPNSINAFCRRFTALEELHVISEFQIPRRDVVAHFKKLWAKCLELRDQLNIPGLKRIFFTIKHGQPIAIPKSESNCMDALKQVEPFREATFLPTRKGGVRMVLKHEQSSGPQSTFFRIESDFCLMKEAKNKSGGDDGFFY